MGGKKKNSVLENLRETFKKNEVAKDNKSYLTYNYKNQMCTTMIFL